MHRSGRLRVLRIPSAADLKAKGNEGMRGVYRDLAGLASKTKAHRVVIEDFTPLVQFSTFDAFAEAFYGLRKALAEMGTSFLLGLGAPANEASRQLLAVVDERVDASLHLQADGTTSLHLPQPPAAPAPAPEPESFAEVAPAPEPAPAPRPTPEPTPVAAPGKGDIAVG